VSEPSIEAAGGIVWRKDAARGELEVCLVHRPRYDDWTFPKGKLRAGESHRDGAEREVEEETGYVVRVGDVAGETRYSKSDGASLRAKRVRYWSMEVVGGRFGPGDEVDEIAWLTVEEALRRLTFDHDRRMLARFRPS
jgi:8-oxo-dGTP pyrophosphatase MutT (NUDIX family)